MKIIIKNSVLALSVVLAALSQSATAGTFGGTAYSTTTTFFSNGAEAVAKAKAVSGKEISTGSIGVILSVQNINEVLTWCTNQPDNGLHLVPSSGTIDNFPSSFQESSDQICDRAKGKCTFNPHANSSLIGQADHPELCQNKTWIVTDMVPTDSDMKADLIGCQNEFGDMITCDADSDGVIDPNVIVTDLESQSFHCLLPDPNTLQFGERRPMNCTPN